MNSFYNQFDTERPGPEKARQDFRSPFQIDRDRILHTSAFRRLQSKTQVFWSGQLDFYRTRLTHSLEVAQIGRSICHYLKQSSDYLDDDNFIDPELVEAACLAHDLGHPPFGHTGERSLNHLMKPYGGFEGNAQTLRLLTETIFESSHRGMNPTRAFLDATLKYKTLQGELREPENHFIYTEQADFLDFALGGRDFPPEMTPGPSRDASKSIECQIMDWADDTAYSLNDLADGVRCGFLDLLKIERWADQRDLSAIEAAAIEDLLRAVRDDQIETLLGRRIGDYIQSTRLEPAGGFLAPASKRYQFKLRVHPDAATESACFKQLAYETIFLNPTLKQLEHKAHHLLGQLFRNLETLYVEKKAINGLHFKILPDARHERILRSADPNARAREVCDFIASLTDNQSVTITRRLFSSHQDSLTDLVF